MKSLMQLLHCVLTDCGTRCCTSTTQDWKTILSRSKHEGLSFLTITLPAFCSEFERALSVGCVDHNTFPSFGKRGGLPRFMGGFLDLIFDRSSGLLLDNPSIEAISSVRQITLMHKKMLLPCSKKRIEAAYDRYIKCENEVRTWSDSVDSCLIDEFRSIASVLWSTDLSIIDRMVYEGDIVPRHGPGATADRLFGNEKFELRTWHHRLEAYFPSTEFIIPNAGYHDRLERVDFVEPGAEQPVRVITVPKTLKTPRIIAIEPTCMQYTQQALMEVICLQLERSNYLSGSVGFTDQVPNQDLARLGSMDGSLATIDLSDASDRVPWLLVKAMLANFPSLAGAVSACRSLRADVPGRGIHSLSKYASMGSATCFPIEAMVFLTIIIHGIQRELNRSLTKNDIYFILKKVRVYGDDIIVPVEYVRSVVESLSLFNMVVNSRKSFWTGKFRESCGRDFYDGHDVTVTYVRRMLPTQQRNASEMTSSVSLRNQLYKAGYWKGANYLDGLIGRLAPFPTVLETSPVLGRHSVLGFEQAKTCVHLHRPLVKGMVVATRPRSSKLDDYGALLKFFLKRGGLPFHDAKHLERYGRPESVDIKIRWTVPY